MRYASTSCGSRHHCVKTDEWIQIQLDFSAEAFLGLNYTLRCKKMQESPK